VPGLATLYVITGALRPTLWHSQPVETAVLTVMAIVSAGIHIRLRAEFRNDRIRLEQAHPLAAGIAGVALFNALLHLLLIPEPEGTTVVILIAMASACFFLDTRWLPCWPWRWQAGRLPLSWPRATRVGCISAWP